MPSPFGQALKILQIAALLLALVLIINLAVHGWLGAILEAARYSSRWRSRSTSQFTVGSARWGLVR